MLRKSQYVRGLVGRFDFVNLRTISRIEELKRRGLGV